MLAWQFRSIGVIDWLQSHRDSVVAAGFLLAILIGGLQLGLTLRRKRRALGAARARLAVAAGLVRRTLESAFRAAAGKQSAREWFDLVGTSAHLVPLEASALHTLRLAAFVPGAEAALVKRAVEQCQAYAARLKYIGSMLPAVRDPHGFHTAYSEEQRRRIGEAARAALSHLRDSIEAFSMVVPRLPEEPRLPYDHQITLLAGSPDPNRLPQA